MKDIYLRNNPFVVPAHVNFIKQGEGASVILIHGLAASLHDWDDLVPELVGNGYSAYALDLLGHGDSPRPASRAYEMDWIFQHLVAWIESLDLQQPPVLVGHSLGGYLTLQYALRFPDRARALVLVDPFYRLSQLPRLLRLSFSRPSLNSALMARTPEWLFRMIVDASSIAMGHSSGGAHNLPAHIRAQTVMDYKRTAAGVYNLLSTVSDLTPYLPQINHPSLVVWGTRDPSLAPSSFHELVSTLANVEEKRLPSGHVPHQSHSAEFNAAVLDFLKRL